MLTNQPRTKGAVRRTLMTMSAMVALAAMSIGGSAAAAGGKPADAGNARVLIRNAGPSGDAAAAVPGELLLKLSSGDLLPALLVRHELTLAARMGARPIFRVRVAAGASIRDKAAALALEAGVLLAEPNLLYAGPEASKNNVWAIGSESALAQQWAIEALRLPEAQQLSTAAGVRVAVLDTGVDAAHPLLAGRLLAGRDFVDGDADPSEAGSRIDPAFGHGTHVAGLIALAAPDARILPLRVLDAGGQGHAWAIAEAMLHAADPDGNPDTDDGAHIINLSLAGPERTRLLDTVALLASCGTPDPAVAADSLSDPGYGSDHQRCSRWRGALVVAAAGNDASASLRAYPAAEGAYGLLAVAASAPDQRLAWFSNSGNWIQIAAPGDGITSSVPGGWGTWSGTSMAAPLVSGVAALVLGKDPAMDGVALARCLTRHATVLRGASMVQVDALAPLVALSSKKQCR